MEVLHLHYRPILCHKLSYKHIYKEVLCDTIELFTVTQALVRFITRDLS